VLTVILGAVCISFAAIFVKAISQEQMGPTAIAFWRTLFGSGILFLLAAIRREPFRLPLPAFSWALLSGFLFAVDLFFWHRSIVYSGAGMATILANTQVFATAALGFLFFKERPTVKFAVAAVAAMGGVVVLIGVGSDIELSGLYLRGVVYGIITGIAYGHYLIALKAAGRKDKLPGFVTLVAWASLSSAICLLAALLLEGGTIAPPSGFAWGMLVLLALTAQALGWWAIATGISKIASSRGGLILLLQPVLAMVWGILFFSESLTILQSVGALVTLGAIYIGAVERRAV
jgi:drug/metabolite transporter (DMT)-like permease